MPSVAIVIPNWNGVAHLPDCLESLAVLDYPADLLEVIVVDNGSTDSSRELLAAKYSGVRVVPLDENLGFAEGCNRGARETDADCVAFLNNDMRVDQGWLRELVSQYEPEAGYVCVAGVILDWEGRHVDFVDGYVNFHGSPGQEHFGKPVADALVEDGRDLLFACGGSMLIGRATFLELGGFDPAYFAYVEDVDLGWRLWVTGHKVRLAGRSLSYHRHHGTSSSIPAHQRVLLSERNSLVTLLKNVSDENLGGLLSAALFLLVHRSAIETGSDRAAFEIGAPVEETETVPRVGLAGLHAATDVLADLTGVLERRQEVQRRRVRSDDEVFALFRRPFIPRSSASAYLEGGLELRAALGLDRLFGRPRATRLLVVGAGDSIRLRRLAAAAAMFVPVTFAATERIAPVTDVEAVVIESENELERLLAESDLVLVEGTSVHADTIARRSLGVLAVDLEGAGAVPHPGLVARGDLFLCSSPDSRGTWLESLGRSGRRAERKGDPSLVVVVPDEDGAGQADVVRTIVEEPWRWSEGRRRSGQPALPEDALVLLRQWRERSETAAVQPGLARVIWLRLPGAVQRPLRRALGR